MKIAAQESLECGPRGVAEPRIRRNCGAGPGAQHARRCATDAGARRNCRRKPGAFAALDKGTAWYFTMFGPAAEDAGGVTEDQPFHAAMAASGDFADPAHGPRPAREHRDG